MSENVAPTNVTTTTTHLGKDERQGLSTSKPTQVHQYQTTTGGTSQPIMREGQEQKESESTLEKIKKMTIGSGKEDTTQRGHETGTQMSQQTNVPRHGEEKYCEQESYGTMRDTDEEHQVLEVTGEGYSNLKVNLLHAVEGSGVRIKSWTEDASTNIRHIICGPNALESIANQQKYIHALNQESCYSVTIPKRSEHHEKKFIPNGYALCWEFTLQSHDIEFIMKEIVQDDNNIVRHTLIGKQLCKSGVKIQGKWEVCGDTNVILVWNNSYSKLTSKTIDYKMSIVNV